jgi:hypothetical protein
VLSSLPPCPGLLFGPRGVRCYRVSQPDRTLKWDSHYRHCCVRRHLHPLHLVSTATSPLQHLVSVTQMTRTTYSAALLPSHLFPRQCHRGRYVPRLVSDCSGCRTIGCNYHHYMPPPLLASPQLWSGLSTCMPCPTAADTHVWPRGRPSRRGCLWAESFTVERVGEPAVRGAVNAARCPSTAARGSPGSGAAACHH